MLMEARPRSLEAMTTIEGGKMDLKTLGNDLRQRLSWNSTIAKIAEELSAEYARIGGPPKLLQILPKPRPKFHWQARGSQESPVCRIVQ